MKNLYFLVMALFVLHGYAYCQVIRVEGKVINTSGRPVSGATITATFGGAKSSMQTSGDGSFSFNAVNSKAVLTITHIGFEEARIFVGGKTQLRITINQKAADLDEVVIQAYGTTTKRLSTGNISKISAKEIESQPVSNPIAALEGRIPGVVISQSSGVAGSSFNIEIRGRTSLDQSLSQNDPLFVIDGVFFEPGNQPANLLRSAANNNFGVGGLSPLNTINPNDIESTEVLKDADATAIYGSRGANGVILITTKRGKEGSTKFTVNVYTGGSRPTRTMPLLNTQQYIALRKEGFKNDGIEPSSDPFDAGYAPDITLWDTTRYTDFRKLLIGDKADNTDASMSLSGGSELTQFLLSGNFHTETTVFSKSLADTRITGHFSLHHSSVNKKFLLSFSGGYSNDKNELIATDLTQYIYTPPNLRLYDDNDKLSFKEAGVSYYTVNGIINPLSVLLTRNTSVINNLYSNLLLSYRIAGPLTFRASFGYNDFKTREVSIIPSTSIDPYVASYQTPSASFANSTTNSWIIEPQLNYITNILAGKVDILAGATLQENAYTGMETDASHYSNDLLLNNPAAAGTVIAQNSKSLYHYEAVFGRVNYNLEDKYILNVTFRRDGSSRFGPGKQFANFGALGVAWVFSAESLMKNGLPFISFGKLRGSYGVTGNDHIGDYTFLNLWSADGTTYQGIQTLLPNKLYNPDLEWETNRKLEVALELGLFKDKLYLSGSYYRNRSSNQLINYRLPTQTGSQSIVANLPALVQNSGIEVVLTSHNIASRNFNWTTSINLTVPRNKLISFPGLTSTPYSGLYVEGQPLSVINRFKYLGVDPATGVYTFEDVNKDNDFNSEDYVVSGYTGPRLFGGILNSIRVFNFQLDFLFEFRKQTGDNYLTQLASSFPGFVGNQSTRVLNRWRQPGDKTEVQQAIATYNNFPALIAANVLLPASNGIYSDASFIRLRNVSLSYAFQASKFKALKLSGLRIYLNAQNLLTITHYKGLDPETQNAYVLPPLQTIVAGIQINL